MKGDSSKSRRRFLAEAGVLTSVAATGCLQTSTEEELPESTTYTDNGGGEDTQETSTDSDIDSELETDEGIPIRTQSPVPYNGIYMTETLEVAVTKPQFYGRLRYGENGQYTDTADEDHWFPAVTVLVANRTEDQVVSAPLRSDFVLVSGNSQYEPHLNAILAETEYEGGELQPGVETSGAITFEQAPGSVTKENTELVWSPIGGDRIVWELTDETPDLDLENEVSRSGDDSESGSDGGISVNIDE